MWHVFVFNRKSPKELVVSCLLEPSNVEKAEHICHMFGLDLQQLVEAAADRQLELGQLESAISLYKLARVCIIILDICMIVYVFVCVCIYVWCILWNTHIHCILQQLWLKKSTWYCWKITRMIFEHPWYLVCIVGNGGVLTLKAPTTYATILLVLW